MYIKLNQGHGIDVRGYNEWKKKSNDVDANYEMSFKGGFVIARMLRRVCRVRRSKLLSS